MLKKSILFLVVSLLLVVPAFAYTISEIEDAGYVETQSDFFTLTDYTTADSGFEIWFEQAAYESDFGLYTVDDISNPNSTTINRLEIFEAAAEPTDFTTNVVFTQEDGDWYASVGGAAAVLFSNTFGFYFDVHTTVNEGVDYSFYTYEDFNTEDEGIEHIRTFIKSPAEIVILLDDQLGPYSDTYTTSGSRDNDWTDMQVFASDIAPVPEPGTLLLLGSGLIGLAYLKRRKS